MTFWTQINIKSSCSHFQLNLSWIAHIFNLTRLDSTENWVNSTWFIKNLSLMSRELNIEIFPIFCFCIIFLHYLFDRKSWRKTWRKINNKIYLYKMLTMNLLQAMLVRRAEQSHQHWQSSNSALLMRWVYTQLKSEAITTRSSACWSLHIHRMTAAYMLQLIYDIYIYIAKAWLSFCTHMNRRDAVNWLIFRIFRSTYTQRNHT